MNKEKISSSNNFFISFNNKEKIIKKNILKKSKESLMIHQNKAKNFNNLEFARIIKSLTDQELNTLNYELALKIDKRTYLQYYWALLKKKHLILFSFLPQDDFNLITLKIVLFILSFSLYFTINGFFFRDETMHKIYKDNGVFNIIYQIPQILYSTLVSSVINIILKKLSLSEDNILKIKNEKNKYSFIRKSGKIKTCLQTKFILFFILTFYLCFSFGILFPVSVVYIKILK